MTTLVHYYSYELTAEITTTDSDTSTRHLPLLLHCCTAVLSCLRQPDQHALERSKHLGAGCPPTRLISLGEDGSARLECSKHLGAGCPTADLGEEILLVAGGRVVVRDQALPGQRRELRVDGGVQG